MDKSIGSSIVFSILLGFNLLIPFEISSFDVQEMINIKKGHTITK